mmetsp:Transcript_27752/g.61254  ORF Transcript_27752/g.61254 Transcript_27752/m.61254 type:complete len:238 (+) Transcript_27752:211-924(+)
MGRLVDGETGVMGVGSSAGVGTSIEEPARLPCAGAMAGACVEEPGECSDTRECAGPGNGIFPRVGERMRTKPCGECCMWPVVAMVALLRTGDRDGLCTARKAVWTGVPGSCAGAAKPRFRLCRRGCVGLWQPRSCRACITGVPGEGARQSSGPLPTGSRTGEATLAEPAGARSRLASVPTGIRTGEATLMEPAPWSRRGVSIRTAPPAWSRQGDGARPPVTAGSMYAEIRVVSARST